MANNIDVLPALPPSRTVTVPRLPPVIIPDSVRILNLTATAFEVELIAYSTPRDVSNANFTFNVRQGTRVDGATTFPLEVKQPFAQWYLSEEGRRNGSLFLLRVPFTAVGSIGALESVTVTITNSVGVSAPETGRD